MKKNEKEEQEEGRRKKVWGRKTRIKEQKRTKKEEQRKKRRRKENQKNKYKRKRRRRRRRRRRSHSNTRPPKSQHQPRKSEPFTLIYLSMSLSCQVSLSAYACLSQVHLIFHTLFKQRSFKMSWRVQQQDQEQDAQVSFQFNFKWIPLSGSTIKWCMIPDCMCQPKRERSDHHVLQREKMRGLCWTIQFSFLFFQKNEKWKKKKEKRKRKKKKKKEISPSNFKLIFKIFILRISSLSICWENERSSAVLCLGVLCSGRARYFSFHFK